MREPAVEGEWIEPGEAQRSDKGSDRGSGCRAWHCAARTDGASSRGLPLVVVQEIFGVNRHIREVAAGFAADGFEVLAPCLFDRIAPAIELDYGEADIEQGRKLMGRIAPDEALEDLEQATAWLAARCDNRPVGIVGYCWGGSLAWLAAARLDRLGCAVVYYGGQISPMLSATPPILPRVPLLGHFGAHDTGIPLDQVERLQEAAPDSEILVYPEAGHGFNCDRRTSFHPESAATARNRSLAFLRRHLTP